MAEVTALRNNATPYPLYGCPFTVVFPFLDADGDLVTAAAAPDAEISKNGDTFADCTNESTEIATSSGIYYLSLTGTELTCDIAAIIAKSTTTGLKTTPIVLYPRKLPTVWSGTAASAGSITSTIILDSGASPIDDFYNGMICVATIDTLVEVRVISDYVGSSKTCTVVPDWNVAPDNDDTFVIKMPEGMSPAVAGNMATIAGVAVSTTTAQLGVNVVNAAGTAWGSGAITAASVATGAITNAKFAAGAIDATAVADGAIDAGAIATGAITNAKFAAGAIDAASIADNAIDAGAIATGAITNAKFAAGAIDATAIAADAIGASELAADAVTEIVAGVWGQDATSYQTQGTFGQCIGDTTGAGTSLISRVPAALVSGRIDASVGAMASGVVTSTAIATDAIGAAQIAADAIGASELATDAVTEIAGSVWDLDATAHQVAGTFGKAIGDPLTATNSLIQRTPDAVAGAANGLFIAGTNAATTITTSFTTTFTGNLTGNVGGSVASVASGGITAGSFSAGAIDATALAADAVDEILDDPIDGSVTLRQALRVVLSALASKVSGAGTTTIAFRDINDTKDRIVATVDADGNRSAVTLTLT